MYRALLLGLGVVVLGSQIGLAVEQDVVPIVPRGEQQVEVITPRGEQAVQQVGGGPEQDVTRQVPPSPGMKTVSTIGKVATGVTAAAVSLGAMAAMLLFFWSAIDAPGGWIPHHR